MYSDRHRPRFGLEALEPRLLLSADAVGTAVQALLPPDPHDAALAAAYAGALTPGESTPFTDPPLLLTNQTITGTSLTINNSLRISGDVSLTATSGNLNVGNDSTDYVGGNSAATTDRLTLRSVVGDVRFTGAVGDGTSGSDPLNALTVIAGDDVTFDRSVVVNGPLVIQARGVVSFNGAVTLGEGGSLTITGASQVFFGTGSRLTMLTGSAAVPGDILIEADEIDLRMGEELITGSGHVTLRPASAAQAVALLNPAGVFDTPAILSLDRAELAAFAEGFAQFTIGRGDGSGRVDVGANPGVDGIALPGPLTVLGALIEVGDYSNGDAILRLGPGDTLRLQASGDIRLANELEADRIELAAGGRVLAVDVTTDGRSQEALRGLALDVTAGGGVSLPRVEVQQLRASNAGGGDIDITVAEARTTTRFAATLIDGSVAVTGLAQTGGDGGITLATRAGSLVLGGSGVAIAGAGALQLQAGGTGSDLRLDAPITIVGGAVALRAADALSSSAAGSITASGPAAITLEAGSGGLVLGAPVATAGGTLTLRSGGALDLSGVPLDAGASGRIALQAVGDLTVGVVAASERIELASSAGAIRDGWAGDEANLRGEAASVTLAAASGIGSGAAPLRSAVGSLVADAGAGALFLAEATGLAVGTAGLRAGGDLVLVTADGALAVAGAVQAGADLLLQAGGATGTLTLGADLQSLAGHVSLVAAQALLVPALAPTTLRTTASGTGLDLRSGGEMRFGADAQLVTANGALRLDAGGALTIGRVDAGTAIASLRAAAGIASADGAPATADVRAGALRLEAGSGAIGTPGDALRVEAPRLALVAGGAAHLQLALAGGDAGLVEIGAVAGAEPRRVATDGGTTTPAPDATLRGAASGGALVLERTAGALGVTEAVSSGATLRLQAPGALQLAAPLAAAGSASLLAGAALTASAAGDIDAATLDVEAGAELGAADGSRWASSGALRVAAAGALTLGQVDAGSASLSLQATGVLASAHGGAAPDLRGGTLRLEAARIGSADDPLRLAADALAARSLEGGLWLTEADALALVDLDALALPARVGSDGIARVPAAAEAALAGLASAGALSLQAAGSLDGGAAAPVNAAGALNLAASGDGADLRLAAPLSAGAALTLGAGRDLQLAADASATAGAQLLAGRDLALQGALATGAADSRLQAGRDLTLGSVDTRGATLVLQAGGAVIDTDAGLDLQAQALQLSAGGAVASAAQALGLQAATLTLAAGGGAWLAATGPLGLLSAGAGGPLQLAATGDLAVSGPVASTGLSLQTDGRLDIGAGVALASGGAAARLQAASTLAMAEGSALASAGGDVALQAGGLATVSRVDAGSGAITLAATALRGTAATAETAPHLAAASLGATLAASGGAPGGLGTGSQPLHTALGRLTADVSGSGGVFIAQRGALVIEGLASGGALVLQARGGLEGLGAISAAGPLRLAADGDAAALRLAAPVRVADGAASLQAGGDLSVASLALAGSNRSAELQAGGRLVLGDGDGLVTQQGAVLARAGGDLVVGRVDAGTAAVALEAARLLDGDSGDDAAAGAAADIVAGALQLRAAAAIGAAGQALEVRVATLSAVAGAGGLFLTEADGLVVGSTAATVQRVNADASLTRVDAAAQEDLVVTDAGALVLVARSGELRLGGGGASPALALQAGSGPVLLQAEAGRLVVDAGLAGGGPLSLRAAGDLALGAGGRVALDGGASADLASGANLLMADGSTVTSTGAGANLRLQATGNLTLGQLVAGGDVSLLARSIADSGGSEPDIVAQALRLVTTGGGAGSGAAPLHTSVALLAAQVAGTGAAGLFVQEADALRTGTVGPVAVQRVAADGSVSILADAALSDVAAVGNVVLRSAGDLRVGDGDANGTGLSAGGNLLLQAQGGAAALVLEPGAALRLAGGHASLLAAGELRLGADLVLERSGRNVDIEAGGAVRQVAGAGIDTNNSDVRVAAGGDIVLARVGAGSGNVSLQAGGAILEALDDGGRGDDGPEIVAAGARLNAGAAVASAAERLELRVGALSARAGDAIWLDEADGVRITDVAVRVNRVGADATAAPRDDAVQSDLVTTGGSGLIALLTRAGPIDLLDGSAPADGRALSSFGGAPLLLQPGGAGAVLAVPGAGGVQQAGAFVLDSGLRLGGAFVVEAGLGGVAGDGDIRIAGPVEGTAGGAADVLELRSDGGDVTLLGAVGATQPLDRVLVAGAGDVRFAEAVRLSGELRVQASGVVRFDGPLQLAGGSLVITGAREVLLGDVSLGSGDVEISADALQLRGTLASGGADARLLLQPGSAGTALRVAEGATAGALVLDAALLARLSGFERVSLAAPEGDLVLDGATLAALAPVRALELGSGGDVALTGAIRLTMGGATLAVQAGAELRMAAGSSLATTGGDLSLVADGDMLLGRVDTRGAGLAAGATLTLQAGGLLRELGSDGVTDLFAERLVLRGLGPLLGPGQSEAGSALDAEVLRVDIDQRQGVVLRDSGADGRTRFNVAVGQELHQPLVVVGAPSRDAPLALPASADAALRAAAQAPDAWRPLSALRLDADGRATRAGLGGALADADDDDAAGTATRAYLDLLLSEAGNLALGLPRLADSPWAGPVRVAGATAVEWWPEWAPQL